jgi:hypothetical protein
MKKPELVNATPPDSSDDKLFVLKRLIRKSASTG